MSRSAKKIGLAIWVIGLCVILFWLLAERMSAAAHELPKTKATETKLVGSGHLAAIFRITWSFDMLPKWNALAEHNLVLGLPWKGIDQSSLVSALHDSTAKVEQLEKIDFRDGMELHSEEKDNAQYRITGDRGWSDPVSMARDTYPLTVFGGIVHMGVVNDNWTKFGHLHTDDPHPRPISPRQYIDALHELVKLPNGKFERRVYVIAVS